MLHTKDMNRPHRLSAPLVAKEDFTTLMRMPQKPTGQT